MDTTTQTFWETNEYQPVLFWINHMGKGEIWLILLFLRQSALSMQVANRRARRKSAMMESMIACYSSGRKTGSKKDLVIIKLQQSLF